jgi:CRISPR/Cas system-associated exonuclease Cas4 (RecB family)
LTSLPLTSPPAFSEKSEDKARDARDFAWSASRHDTFATCPRKYYYSYYGILEDPEVQRLKQLSALALWAGSVVHETIEDFLRTNDAIPEPAVQEAMIRAVVHERMLREWKESESGTSGFRLFEHEYTQPIEQEDKKILVGIVMRSLRNFFRSPLLREAFKVRRSAWLSMEELVSFHVDDVPVFLRMDLAFRDERGRVRIVDWKTGRRAGKFNDVQIAGYALYAAEKGWAASATEISTELAYLIWPRYVRKDVTQPILDTARRFVTRSAKTMRALLNDPEANFARIEDFPRIDRPRVCRRCNFRKLCFPRAEMLEVRSTRRPAPKAP